MAKDANMSPSGSRSSGFAIAFNTRSKGDVDAVLAEVVSCGAEIVTPAHETFWGGYSGYFRDPDGPLWEVAWNPDFALDGNGAVQLPD